MNEIGHNNPPDMAITAGEVTKDLSGWMAENPIIETEEQARQAKVWNDRAYLCLQDLDEERQGKVKPLNEKVKEINLSYRGPCDLLAGVMHELRARVDRFLFAEEAKRKKAAEEARRIAEEAERAARVAEQREHEALAEADSGVLGVDIAAVTATADQAFAVHQRADRQAKLAEKETHVKVGGGFRRSLSLRNTEVIHIDDAAAVLAAVGLTVDIEAAMRKAANAYKRLHGKYPPGITVTIERGT